MKTTSKEASLAPNPSDLRELFDDMLAAASLRWSTEDLTRLRAAADVWMGKQRPQTHHMQSAKGFFISGLKDKAWIDPSGFPFAQLLLDNYLAIAGEAEQFINGTISAPPYGLADAAVADAQPIKGNPDDWREWRLYHTGGFNDEKCAHFPATVKTVQAILDSTSFMMNAIFLILGPGQHLSPHTDQNNIFVNIWLPLVTPEGCYLTVKDKTVQPKAGELLAFNHSYLHSAGNPSRRNRVVLALSVFHPELTEVERQVIAQFAPMLARAIPRPGAAV